MIKTYNTYKGEEKEREERNRIYCDIIIYYGSGNIVTSNILQNDC